jgi:hypothetical protein
MKANLIIIAFVALASQINSTFAQTAANPESVNTLEGRAITVDVLANDNPTIDNNIPTIVNADFANPTAQVLTTKYCNGCDSWIEFALILFFQPVIVQGTATGVAGAGAGVTTQGAADGTILYTPANGFVGTVTFEYQIGTLNTGASTLRLGGNRRAIATTPVTLTGIVTVTVTAKDIRADFKAQNQFSTESALAAVSFSPALNNNVFQNLQARFADFFAARGGV